MFIVCCSRRVQPGRIRSDFSLSFSENLGWGNVGTMHTFTSRRLTAALLIIGTVLWFSCFRNGDGSWITSPTSPTDPDALLDSRIRNSTLGVRLYHLRASY